MKRAIIRDCPSDHDENVERHSDASDSNDDGSDRQVDGPKIPRQGIPEEKQSGLEHKGKTLHNEVEFPRDHAAEFTLTVSAFVDFGTPDFGFAEAV